MTAIGYVIQPGEDIPDDVTEVDDVANDSWGLGTNGWSWAEGRATYVNWPAAQLVEVLAPLTVTAVREQSAEPERHACWKCGLTVGDIVDRGAGAYADGRLRFMHAGGECPTVDTLPPELKRRLAAPGPQQADASPLLDLVGQYGDKRVEAVSVEECGGDGEPYEREAAVLLARIAALVPQQPVRARNVRGDLLWLSESGTVIHAGQPPSGRWLPLLVGGNPAPEPTESRAAYWERRFNEEAASHDEDALRILTLHRERDEARRDVTRYRSEADLLGKRIDELTAQPDPLVLSLPEGTVALIGGRSGRRFTRVDRDGPKDWWNAEDGRQSLGSVMDLEGAVRVVLGPPPEPVGQADTVHADGTHTYWSTHCRHGNHEACSATSMVRNRAARGPAEAAPRPVEVLKAAAQCKTCAAPCVCPCHEQPRVELAPPCEPRTDLPCGHLSESSRFEDDDGAKVLITVPPAHDSNGDAFTTPLVWCAQGHGWVSLTAEEFAEVTE